ncbi:MAG: hypothetical protein HC887_11220, partial [Desulfobacteraceae bacterium]|nr:hypothetical protein [Desulfobacteraceae bacterium]
VAEMRLISPNTLDLTLRTESNIRPTEIIKEIFRLPEEVIRVADMIKLKNPK